MRNKPHKLTWLENMQLRTELTPAERKEYQRLSIGYQGEVAFDSLFGYFVPKAAVVWDDLNLSYQGNLFQMDKSFISGNTWHFVDVKNYQGNYQYQKGRWFRNEQLLTYNLFEQMQRSLRIGDRMMADAQVDIRLQGHIVFIQPQAKILLQEKPPIQVVTYAQLQQWLTQLNGDYQTPFNRHCENVLWRFQVPPYRSEQGCSEERLRQLRKGFHCAHCGSFAVDFDTFKMECCSCGQSEAKEEVYTRTVCEYGVLMHHKPLTKKELMEFLGEQASSRYLKIILRKHFELERNNGKSSCYKNKGVPFEEWFADKRDYFKKVAARVSWRK